ncbi:MAG: hypothetical protein ABSA47_01345 [Verrucomicrobiota bacterium]|jgi:hypothetical protein
MKIPIPLILAGIVLAGAASGQTEQWLQYRTGGENRAYQQIQLTTNPPPGVALPKLNAPPWFARWATPMDPAGGRWICLGRTRASGPYDRLYIDSNGNGRLDDKKPLQARVDSSESTFPPATLVFKGEDGPITYNLDFLLYQFQNGAVVNGPVPAELLVSPGGWYEGLVNFDGVKKRVQLIDGNANGSFNDVAEDPYQSDRVRIEGDKTAERFLGRMLEVDGKFFRVEVARDGAFVKVQKVENATLGRVLVPTNISEVSVYGQNGHFVRKPVNGEFTLPEGGYRIVEWTINRKDEKGAAWTLTGSAFPKTATFDVAADRTNTLEIGEPVRAVLGATQSADRQDVFSLRFEGRQKETIQMLRGGQRPAGPKLTLARADGTVCYSNSFEFG